MTEPIRQEEHFAATPQAVFDALTDSAKHGAFTESTSEIDKQPGGAFSCHDGQITGRTLELVEGKRIVQAWRVSAWDEGVYTTVSIELEPADGGTKLTLVHRGVDEAFREHIAGGWHARYWEPLRAYL